MQPHLFLVWTFNPALGRAASTLSSSGLVYRWTCCFAGSGLELKAGLTAEADLAGAGCEESAGFTSGLAPAAGGAEGLAAG